jgi:hypothetical protein
MSPRVARRLSSIFRAHVYPVTVLSGFHAARYDCTLVSLVYCRRVIRTAYFSGTAYTVTLKDVPLASGSRVGAFQGNGADLQRYVAGVQYLDGQVSGGQIISNFEYVGTDWTAGAAQSPTLKLSFGG